jgi:hypothetical protein
LFYCCRACIIIMGTVLSLSQYQIRHFFYFNKLLRKLEVKNLLKKKFRGELCFIEVRIVLRLVHLSFHFTKSIRLLLILTLKIFLSVMLPYWVISKYTNSHNITTDTHHFLTITLQSIIIQVTGSQDVNCNLDQCSVILLILIIM